MSKPIPSSVLPIGSRLIVKNGDEVYEQRARYDTAEQSFVFGRSGTRLRPHRCCAAFRAVVLTKTFGRRFVRNLLAHDTRPLYRWEQGACWPYAPLWDDPRMAKAPNTELVPVTRAVTS